jgi:hypothetical protein
LLGDYLIQRAADLEDRWGGTITLLTTENKLNSTGSLTFTECIPGLMDICPDIFETSTEQLEFEANTTPTALQTGMTAQMSSRLQGALDDLSSYFGVPALFIGGIAFAIVLFILIGRIFTATQSVTIAVVVSMPLIILANMIGLIPIAITWAAVIIVAVVFGIVFILGRLA